MDDFSLLFFALSFFGWVETARFVRAQVLALREEEFVVAAGEHRRHHAAYPGVASVPGRAAVDHRRDERVAGRRGGGGGRAHLAGAGIQPPTASFGAMITDAGGARTFDLHPHLLLVPGVDDRAPDLAFNLLGDAINDVVSPRGT